MATQQIAWGDGSGDKIYVTYPSATGDQTLSVSSDANTGSSERSKTVTFQTTSGSPTVRDTIIVTQPGKPLDYFWFKARSAGSTISMNCPGNAHPVLYYSTDKSSWQLWDYSAITLSSVDDQVWFYGTNTAVSSGTGSNYAQFVTTGSLDIGGDITALIKKEGMVNDLANYSFRYLFRDCASIVNARDAYIGGTVKRLRMYCCDNMFYGCTALVSAPSFKYVPQASNIYISTYSLNNMFYGCSSLTDVSGIDVQINGTGGANYAAAAMFQNCTSLTAAPKITITSTANYIGQNMFNGCSALKDISNFSITATGNGYCGYMDMFYNCSSLTTTPSLPATTLNTQCYRRMFYGCTSLTSAPVLPAETLVSNCYQEMFRGCSSLSYIKAMFTTTPGNSYTSNWVNGVASSGTFVKNSAATWNVNGNNGVPNNWTVQTAS